MGWLTPKYPISDTTGATGTPPARESRGARRQREQVEAARTAMDDAWKDARRASTERDAGFWEDYERRHGPGSVDHS